LEIIIGGKELIDYCLALAKQLPQYFTDKALVQMSSDLQEHTLYVALESYEVQGFATVFIKNSSVAELTWLAVNPNFQHKHIGISLVEKAEADLRALDVKFFTVKTLAATASDIEYDNTIKFYEASGFLLLETIDPYPGWDPGNPCAIYIKQL
jgi:N-acetylglutamate synthase-like GNAT family acetyltransferase